MSFAGLIALGFRQLITFLAARPPARSTASVFEDVTYTNNTRAVLTLTALLSRHVYLGVALPCHIHCVLTHLLRALVHVLFVVDVFLGCVLLMKPTSDIAIQVCSFVGAASGPLVDFAMNYCLMHWHTTEEFTASLVESGATEIGQEYSLSLGVAEIHRQIDDGFVVAPDEDDPVPRCVDLGAFADDVDSIEDHAWVETAEVIIDSDTIDIDDAGNTMKDRSSSTEIVNNGFRPINNVVIHHVNVPHFWIAILLSIFGILVAVVLVVIAAAAPQNSQWIATGFMWCIFFWDMLLVQCTALLCAYLGYLILELPLLPHPQSAQFVELKPQ